MYCRKCGKKLEEGDRYCPYCGEKTIHHDVSGENSDVLKAVEQLKAGDEEGFNNLYFSTYNFVYSRARYILNDEDEALDLVQEVYMALYNDIGSLKDDSKIYSWIGAVTFRQAMKIFRKNKRQVLLSEEAEGMFDRIQDDELTPEEGVMDTQDVDVIQGCISKLSPEQKAVILAYYFDGLKVDEIAAIMEISEGTVKSRLYLARKNLKKLILEQEEKQGYRLHVFGVPALIFVLKGMLNDTRLSEAEAKREYRKIAESIGDSIIDEAAGEVADKAADEMIKKSMPAGNVAKKAVSAGSVAKKAAVLGNTKLVLAFAGVAAVGTGIGIGAAVATSKPNTSNETTSAIVVEETVESETIETVETVAETEAIIEVPDYNVNYREAYRQIVTEWYNQYPGVAGRYVIYDFNNDGIDELIVRDTGARWEATQRFYVYDMENAEVREVARLLGAFPAFYRESDDSNAMIMVDGYQAVQNVYRVTMDDNKEIQVEKILSDDALEPGEDFYSTPYPLDTHGGEDLSWIDSSDESNVCFFTGLTDENRQEIFRVSSDVMATSVSSESSVYNLIDLDGSTGWAPGTEDTGVGQTIVFSMQTPREMDGIAILPGLCSDEEAYKQNGRPLSVQVQCGGKTFTKKIRDFQPDFNNPLNSMIYIEFGETITSDRCTLVISSVEEESEGKAIYMSEAFPYTLTSNGDVIYLNEGYDKDAAKYYSDILEEYKAAQKMGFNVDREQYPHINKNLIEYGLGDTELYYTTIDLCEDGEPELFIASVSPEDSTNYEVYDIYGISKGEAVHLKEGQGLNLSVVLELDPDEEMGHMQHYYIAENNMIEKYESDDENNYKSKMFRPIANDILIAMIRHFGKQGEQYTKGGAFDYDYITESEYQEIKSQYPRKTDIEWLRVDNFLKR